MTKTQFIELFNNFIEGHISESKKSRKMYKDEFTEEKIAFYKDTELYLELLKGLFIDKIKKVKEPKTQTAWVIMRDDGKYANQVYVNFSDGITYLDWTDNLCKLTANTIFETKAEAEACINLTFYTKNCKPVKITISVEEE